MADGEALSNIFSVTSGVWTIAAVLALFVVRIWNSVPALMGRWIEWRQAKAAEKAADWTRLRDEIDRLWDECASLRKAVKECEEREGEWMHRAIAAEAALIGGGKARQEAARIVATERIADSKKRDAGK